MAGGVTVVGSFNVDHVWSLATLPQPGETRSGCYASGAGGKGFNQAVASARSGAATRFVCALGDDAGGAFARALAVADDIDLRDAASTHPTGAAGIFVAADGRNCIVVASGANLDLDGRHVREAMLQGACAVVLAQLETPAAAARAAFECGRAQGAVAMLNPAPVDAALDADLLALVDVLTPNETEFAAHLARVGGVRVDPASLTGLGDHVLHTHCRALLPAGTVVVTLGAAGAFVSHADGRRHGDDAAYYRVAAPAVAVVDTTGAGDALNGALAASLAQEASRPFREHLAYAIAYASLSTEQPGAAASMPHRDQVERRIGR